MQATPVCLLCVRPDLDEMVCAPYPAGIPWRIVHGAGCDYFRRNPDALPPSDDPFDLKTPVKSPI